MTAPVSIERFVEELEKLKGLMESGELQHGEYDRRLARVIQELRERGIDDALIDDVLKSLDDFWLSRLKQLCQRRLQQPKNLADKARQQRFLRQRGFTFEQINQVFK